MKAKQTDPSQMKLEMLRPNDDRPPLPEGWRYVPISEILDIQYGKGLTKASRDESGTIPVYGSNGIVGHHTEALVEEPCIVIGRKGAAGIVHYATTPCWPIDTAYYATPRIDLLIGYVVYYLQSANLGILDKSTAIPSLSRDDLYAQSIPLAPLPEQRRIVDVIETQFTRLDAAVAALERAKANLARYKASVLKAACEGRLVPAEAELYRDRTCRGGASPESPTHSTTIANANTPQSQITTGGCLALPQRQRPAGKGEAFLQQPGIMTGVEDARVGSGQGSDAECPAPTMPHDVDDECSAPTAYEPADVLLRRILAERRARWEAENPGKRYKEPQGPDTSDLPELPEGWCWATLDELAWHITSGSRGWAKYYSEHGATFIRAQDIKTDNLILENVAHVSLPEMVEGIRTKVSLNDLLITITGANVTKTALVEFRLENAYVSQHVGLVRPVLRDTSRYLYYWIISPSNGRQILEKDAYGAGKPGLNLTNLRELTVALPPLAEQYRIVAEVERRLSVVAEVEAAVDANLARAERLRQAILKRAFEGRLVPQDPNDEPASALLERIGVRCP